MRNNRASDFQKIVGFLWDWIIFLTAKVQL